MGTNETSSRRSFLQTSATVAGASLLPGSALAAASGRQDELLKVALIGCGGRGSGAITQALRTAGNVRLVALADAFRDRLDGCLAEVSQNVPEDRIDVPEERKFVGFDAYEKAMAEDVDVVVLTTPPGFRPMHFEHAIAKGKHVFMEKPVAVDGPGIRKVLAAGEEAKRKNLKVGVGLQRHHSAAYIETVRRIHAGAIGDIRLLRVYWNSAGVWTRPREEGQSEMEYQMRNWYYFNWLCGDHICEQHIHNLDVGNWVMKGYPVKAQGQGGRQVRTGIEHGEIFDHHMVEYTYADGTVMLSQCRHIPGTATSVSEHAHGTTGSANIGASRIETPQGKWRYQGEGSDPYQVEHDKLFAAIRADEAYSEVERGAKSTLTAILGRMATYSGQKVTWDQALNSDIELAPEAYAWNAAPPTMPDSEGRYPIPTPGVTKSV